MIHYSEPDTGGLVPHIDERNRGIHLPLW
jgi:hypothetical protein